jgi:adenylate cyclase
MASTKVPPPLPAVRAGATAMKTSAMKGAPVVMKAAPTATKAVLTAPTAVVAPASVVRTPMLVAFIDLARFQISSRRLSDEALAELVQDYYERVTDGLKGAGGRIVKFMGDGVLAVFPVDRASQAARTLLLLKQEIDARLAKRMFASTLVIRVNAGDVMAGEYGPKADRRFDVIGSAVNRAAAMRYSEGMSLTPAAYEKLDARTQKLFKVKGDVYIAA